MKHIISFSGGHDSTALVLFCIKNKLPLDSVCFADTTLEFPLMYEHIKKVEIFVKNHGIAFETVYPKQTFEQWFYGSFAKAYPHIKQLDICKGRVKSKIIYREQITEQQVKDMFDTTYWIQKYFLIRVQENGNNWDDKRIDNTMRKILDIYRYSGLRNAIEYLNKEILFSS
jgi:hypothetical protein